MATFCEAIIDTRKLDEQVNRWGKTVFVPIAGTGQAKQCDICGRTHEVHCYVRDRDTKQLRVVGEGCAKRLGAVMTYAEETNTSPAHAKKFAALSARYA